MLGEEGGKDASGVHEHGDDVFLKKIESHLLTQASTSHQATVMSLSASATHLDTSLLCQLLGHGLELQQCKEKHS